MKAFLSQVQAADPSFVILYGSQLGQAKSIAEGLVDVTHSEHELKTLVFPLNDIKDITDLPKVTCPIVIITSTTGDGEPPENADKFFRKLRKKSLSVKTLHTVRYTILGLGDTNFNNFCNCGKTIHAKFQELGAALFYPPAWADDAVGLEETVDSWIEGLWPAINSALGLGSEPSASSDWIIKLFPLLPNGLLDLDGMAQEMTLTLPTCPPANIKISYTEDIPQSVNFHEPAQPYPLQDGESLEGILARARFLTKGASVKTTLELTVQMEPRNGKKLDFEPGDAVGIICPNPSAEVDSLLGRLNVKDKADQVFTLSLGPGTKGKVPNHLPAKTTLRNSFLYFIDIRTPPKKAFLRLLAEATTDESEKNVLLELCSKQGGVKYEETVRTPSLSILDLLLKYPSCQPRVEALIEHCPRLIPRSYSISSSPLSSSSSFTFAFNVISLPKEDGRLYSRLGLCTGWLYQMASQNKLIQSDGETTLEESLQSLSLADSTSTLPNRIIFYRRKNHHFRLPVDLKAPVIMVGPGTGVAPFIGFTEHRQFQKKSGKEIGPLALYFGCRQKGLDFIYQETMETLTREGVLSELNVTFSRDPNNGGIKYVQDLMRKKEADVVSTLLDKGGYLYVCGDAKNMAKNVREKLIEAVRSVKGLTEEEAMKEVGNLVTSKRYLQDVWS